MSTNGNQTSGDQSLLTIVADFLRQDEWPISQLPGQSILHSRFKGVNGKWDCFAQTLDEADIFVFYSVLPEKVPEPKRQAVAEVLTRLNYGIRIGNFEMDFGDGEIRYRTGIDVEGDRLTPALITRLVYANVQTMDEHLPAIMAVIEKDVSPAEAVGD